MTARKKNGGATPAKKTAPRKAKATVTKKTPARKRGTLMLDRQLRIDSVIALKEALGRHLVNTSTLTIDASRVEKTDTSALQLLTAFSLAAARNDTKIRWLNPSEPLLRAAALLGLDEILHIAPQPRRPE